MKIKRFVLAIFFLAIAFGAYYIFFVSQTITKTTNIPLPPERVSQQIADPANVVKWYIPFANAGANPDIQQKPIGSMIKYGNDSIEIRPQSMYNTAIYYYSGAKQKEFFFSTLPDMANPSATVVTMMYKTTLFKEWFGKNESVKYALRSFINFKEYTEDTKRFYGYEINPVSVIDTAFIFMSETVPAENKRMATRQLFERLIAYAEKRNAGYNGVRIFYSQKSGNEITLFASVGVTNRITIDSTEQFQYKMMPFQKNLLEATYQGPYGESDKVFRALEQFKTDHDLTSMAIPFQKFLSDGYDFADDQLVQMKVYYPIF